MIHLPTFCERLSFLKHPFSMQMLASVLLLPIIGALALAQSSEQAAPVEVWKPDVLVLVMEGFGAPGSEKVSINYSGTVSEAQVAKDIEDLKTASAWLIPVPQVTTASDHTPGSAPSTSVSFDTRGIVDTGKGALWLEPFIVVLKRFKHIEVNYINLPDMDFHGLKDFRNDFVKIKMSRSGNAYRYKVTITNDGFTSLNLPLVLAKDGPAQNRPASAGPRILLIVGAALLAAVIVYFAVVALSKSRSKVDK